MPKKSTTGEFVEKAKLIHNNFYTYSKAVYYNTNTCVIITCPEHGDFLQSPHNHLAGNGCESCAMIRRIKSKVYTQEEILNIFKIAHGDYYNYDNVTFNRVFEKVEIICPIHGKFLQTPREHMEGHGCQKCGYKNAPRIGFTREGFVNKYKDKNCILYITKLFNDKEEFIKIGITGDTIAGRKIGDKKYQYIILSQIEDDSKNIWSIEQYLHSYLRNFKYKPNIKFRGHTECFTTDALLQIPKLIT